MKQSDRNTQVAFTSNSVLALSPINPPSPPELYPVLLLLSRVWDYRCAPYLTHSNHLHRRTGCYFLWVLSKILQTIRQIHQFGKMELVVDTLSKKSKDLCQLFILPTFCSHTLPVMDTQLSSPSTNKDRKSPLPITEVHGCACKEQAVYTVAPPTLQHTSVLSEDTGRASKGSETITGCSTLQPT